MRFKSPFLVKVAGYACGTCLKIVFRTLRKDVRLAPNVRPFNNQGPERFIFSAWHDSAVLAAFGGKHERTVALTSRHRDGTFVESIVGSVGVNSVRGSSARGGQRAARELLKIAQDHDIVITPDGPRGPRRVMSKGIVYLASRTGNAMVPTAYACEKAWEIPGSWTTQTIPKPFSSAVFLAGDAIFVPPDLDRDGIEHYRVQMQNAMNALQERATATIKNRSALATSRELTSPELPATSTASEKAA